MYCSSAAGRSKYKCDEKPMRNAMGVLLQNSIRRAKIGDAVGDDVGDDEQEDD